MGIVLSRSAVFGPLPATLPGLTLGLLLLGCAAAPRPEAGAAESAWPQHVLQADRWWTLNLPEGRRLDASGLLQFPDGELWTVNDQSARLYRLQLRDDTNAVDLVRVPGWLTAEQTRTLGQGSGVRLDCEGIARDDQGRIYVAEEARRQILRWDRASGKIERLPIDWAPVRSFFHPTDSNASFEGVAFGGGRLYVANERQTGRIVVVDPESWKVVDHFAVRPAGSTSDDTHYTDLCWAEDSLWVLLRDERKVLRVDPGTKRVLAEFNYAELELAPQTAYSLLYAPGFMEGLAVDSEHIWLLTDNNGVGRRAAWGDSRPTLFRCRRPDRADSAPHR